MDMLRNNLEKMLSNEKGGMYYLLQNESIGGNAGSEDGQPCVAANFYFDRETGEIYEFTNLPLEDGQLLHGTFRIVMDFLDFTPPRILQLYTNYSAYYRAYSELVHRNLLDSIKAYNEEIKKAD